MDTQTSHDGDHLQGLEELTEQLWRRWDDGQLEALCGPGMGHSGAGLVHRLDTPCPSGMNPGPEGNLWTTGNGGYGSMPGHSRIDHTLGGPTSDLLEFARLAFAEPEATTFRDLACHIDNWWGSSAGLWQNH